MMTKIILKNKDKIVESKESPLLREDYGFTQTTKKEDGSTVEKIYTWDVIDQIVKTKENSKPTVGVIVNEEKQFSSDGVEFATNTNN